MLSARGGDVVLESCGMSSPPSTHPLACCRKPQKYDGRVPWDAFQAQFEILAEVQAWDSRERAVQLVSSLKDAAVEVLSQLIPLQRTSYDCVVVALEWRYEHKHQAEAFRASFRARMRGREELLQHLAQE